MANQNRIGGVDFARGVVLVAIMIDHVPGNLLEALTPRNFALSDSAEAFVFLSGVSVGLAYYRRSLVSGFTSVARSCLSRAARIYGVHVALTASAVVIFGICYALSGLPGVIEPHGRAVVLQEPLQGALGVVLLTHQLGYFNILPLYVVLMAVSPLILALARIEPLLALLAASGAYLAARMFNLHLSNWPEPGAWFLNPFAWQLIFTLGVVAAIRWREAPLPRSQSVWVLCFALTAAGALVVTDGLSLVPGLHDRVFAELDVTKQNLGAARLVNFLALAYLVATSPYLNALARTGPGLALQALGRHSLVVFAASSVLSAFGQAGAAAWTGDAELAKWLEMGYTLACIGGLFALARYLEWRKASGGEGLGSGSASEAEGSHVYV
jgi:hypothetical protein